MEVLPDIQNSKVTLLLKKASLEDFINSVEKQTSFRFTFDEKELHGKKALSISVRNEPLNKVLEQISAETGLEFKLINNNIHIRLPKAEAPSASFSAVITNAQAQITVTGRVTDKKGIGLPGVTVLLQGTSTAAPTDMEGNFSLTVPDGKGTLVFSYIGYQTQEVPINNRTTVNVTLADDTRALEEVVVVGYGTQKKISTTAAVSSVKGDELEEAPVANISNSIAGRVAGVSMRPNGGQPGSDAPDIHLRGIGTTGNNQPLIVVDGIIRDNMNQLDPTTIESVSVLKDAAAVAPYGLGGANGVILITTKKGQKGAPTLSFNTYYGIQTPTYYPEMLNAQDYMRLHNEAYLNENPTGTQLPYDENLINNYDQLHAQDPDRYPETDTRDIINMNAPIQNYNVQLSGGSDRIKYYAGLGFLKQDGMFDQVGYSRYNYNINLESEATKTTTVSLSLLGTIEKSKSVDAAVSTGQLFRSAYKLIPLAHLYYSNNLWGEFAGNSPVGILNAGYLNNTNNTLLTTLAIKQELSFIKGLSIKGTFSYDPSQRTIKSWHTPFYFYSQDTTTTPYTYTRQISTSEGGAATYTWLNQQYSKSQNFTYQGYLNYQNTFGKHEVTGLIVAEARTNAYEFFSARRNNFPVNVDELNMGSSDKNDFDNSGSSSTGSQLGFVYRFGYNFANKYLLEASGRYDGHYYFAPNKRWGYFPAFSVGWVLSEENFIRNNASFINFLKLRGSWGKSGNLAGSAFQYLNGYNLYGNAYAFGNGTMVPGTYIPLEANPNITWEISTKSDVGFEATLWNGLLDIEADYFHERRTGMLLPPAVSVPVEYGLPLSDENEGIMSNHGIELTLGTSHQFDNGLSLSLDGNFSYAKNKMLQVFETSATRNDPNRSRTGRPLGTPFGYHALGLFSTADDKNDDGIIDAADGYDVIQFGDLHPGDIRYEDISGPEGKPDGKIDSNDETVIGYPVYPFISYGFTPSASWKGFDLSLFFQGSALASLDIRGFQTIPFNNNNSNSSYEYYNNHWTPNTPDARYPRANQSPYANNTQSSDFWMANTGYLRLKTAVLGYTIPQSITQSLRIQAVRVYFSGQNLLTTSKLNFMDPEVGYTDRETAYPNQKVYTLGLNATF
ncbi:TonB-dependent receptor [Pontibacter sp. 172403-2]|nr:TonB-dependent receptor [Pontibacter sp. 172403-2]